MRGSKKPSATALCIGCEAQFRDDAHIVSGSRKLTGEMRTLDPSDPCTNSILPLLDQHIS